MTQSHSQGGPYLVMGRRTWALFCLSRCKIFLFSRYIFFYLYIFTIISFFLNFLLHECCICKHFLLFNSFSFYTIFWGFFSKCLSLIFPTLTNNAMLKLIFEKYQFQNQKSFPHDMVKFSFPTSLSYTGIPYF